MLLTVYPCFKILLNIWFTKMNAPSRKRIFFWCYWIHIACKWKLLWRIWISQDVNESLKTLLNVYNYADILIEGAFRAIECRLAQMNVFSHYCLTFSANDCFFSLNEIQKVYYPSDLFRNTRRFENRGIFSNIPLFWLGNIQPGDMLRPIVCKWKYLMD